MNKLQLSVFTITLLALLSSVFLFAFVTDSQTNSKATAIHAKDGKELLSQAYYLEESELDLDEKLQDFKNASLLLISLCFSFLFLYNALFKTKFFQYLFGKNALGLPLEKFLSIRAIRL